MSESGRVVARIVGPNKAELVEIPEPVEPHWSEIVDYDEWTDVYEAWGVEIVE